MTMVCDRCGDCFYWYEEIDSKENEPLYGNSVQRTIIDERYVPLNWIPDVTPIVLCPSCMAKLNDWLKGEQFNE